jgi:hypothetical protein
MAQSPFFTRRLPLTVAQRTQGTVAGSSESDSKVDGVPSPVTMRAQ